MGLETEATEGDLKLLVSSVWNRLDILFQSLRYMVRFSYPKLLFLSTNFTKVFKLMFFVCCLHLSPGCVRFQLRNTGRVDGSIFLAVSNLMS